MYTDETLKKVKSFGALQYGVDKMITILQPENPTQFISDFSDENSVLHAMWMAGFNSGQYNLDAQQFEISRATAEKTKAETDLIKLKVKAAESYAETKKELYGL